jgi:hypothetical protein
MSLVKALQMFDDKPELTRTHIQEFSRHMMNTGLFPEFQFRISENKRPEEIHEDQRVDEHLQNFSGVPSDIVQQERERIDDTLLLFDRQPLTRNDNGTSELASIQHGMWMAELLENSWSEEVCCEMTAFDEETKGDGVIFFYVFLREFVGYTKEAMIAAEQQLTKEKLSFFVS